MFLLYDVNFGEGFNLRRDVYMRVANAVRSLRESGHNYVLVLPPWGRLQHWQRMQVALPWRLFFDVHSLNRFIPVIEFEDFLEETENIPIDQVLYLQHYEEGWGTEFVRKFDERPCIHAADQFYRKDGDEWKGWFYSYGDVRARNFECVSIQGDSDTLKNLLTHANFSRMTSVFVDRAETILHEHYGEVDYWRARRSMRYSEQLVEAADAFRRTHLDSDDKRDKTELVEDWTKENSRRTAIGGPYLGIHWRRRDFLYARRDQLPTVKGTAALLHKLCEQLKLERIYLATDAPEDEVDELKSYLKDGLEVFRFTDAQKFNDGQIAIIDQYLCAHARHFIGSHESTFTFRIQEDREILGFPIASTFNRLCPDHNADCEQPAKEYECSRVACSSCSYRLFSRRRRLRRLAVITTTTAVSTTIADSSGPRWSTDSMRCSDLKRAVEDVVLRPDENRLTDMQHRDTIAALDLCQLEPSPSAPRPDEITVSAMNACSCSSEIVGVQTSSTVMADSSRPAPPLCASSSLDAIMFRQQPIPSHRHSASGSRRQSRVYANLHSKRKRSNSLTNYNKGQSLSVSLPPSARHTPHRFVNEEEALRSSLASSDSHSSVARSDEYNNGYVLEEEETSVGVPHENPSLLHSNHSTCSSSSSSNPFTSFRQPRNDYDEDMMDCD
ncbi:unnamed protein product [Caenorhabditis sp. 36 PRJEB53466]|nr:unnamed protein product [Caenorhabditis sp. 36 PRJEB53466]